MTGMDQSIIPWEQQEGGACHVRKQTNRKKLFSVKNRGLVVLVAGIIALLLIPLGTLVGQSESNTPNRVSPSPQAPSRQTPANSDLEVAFLDVGQADAALVSQNGHYMLIDGGNSEDSSLIYTVLKDKNITKLDYIINSHPHEDHVGGLSGALQRAQVDKTFSSVTDRGEKTFENFKAGLTRQGVEITVPNTGDAYQFANSTFTFIQPDKEYGDYNEDSLVVLLVYGDTRFLFTGDIGWDAEKDLVESGLDLEADVLKVPHHGSKYSSSYQFLRAVNPLYAVISVGADNDYGHPTDEALSKYRDQGATLYRTDLQGDVTMLSNGKSITVLTEKSPTGNVFAPQK
jgi:competence protein ComEC